MSCIAVKSLLLVTLVFVFCFSRPVEASSPELSEIHSKKDLPFSYNGQDLNQYGIMRLLAKQGPDYRQSVLEVLKLRRKAKYTMLGTGLGGSLALIAGVVMIGIGDNNSAAMLGSGIGVTLAGVTSIGIGFFCSNSMKKRANNKLVDSIKRFNKEQEMQILPGNRFVGRSAKNIEVTERFLIVGLHF